MPKKLPMKFYILAPVILLFGLATTVATLQSYLTTSKFIGDFLESHTHVISDSIMTQLDDFFAKAIESTEINSDLIASGALNPTDYPAMAKQFLSEIKHTPYMTYISMGFENDEYIGASRQVATGEINIYTSLEENNFNFSRHEITPNNEIGPLLEKKEPFMATSRDWYKSAKALGGPSWYPVYKYAGQDALGIGVSAPVFNDKNHTLIGVITADLALNRISQFLGEVELGKEGIAFIAEPNGNLVATSSPEPVYVKKDGDYVRYTTSTFPDPRLTEAAKLLKNQRSTPNSDKGKIYRAQGKGYHFDYAVYTDDLGQELVVGVILSVNAFTDQYTRAQAWSIALGLGFLLLIGALLIYILQRVVLPPIQRLVEAQSQVKQRDYTVRLPETPIRELSILSQGFNETIAALENYEKIEDLYIAHEKMAALGGLVSGITHEINTPLGMAITISSYIEKAQRDLLKHIVDQSISREKFIAHAQEITEDLGILQSNLRRASELIKSFKAIAVGQSNEQEVRFNISELIGNIMVSLKHEYRPQGHQLVLTCPQTLEMVSFPGAITQILTNLIMNSIIHGFSDRQNGLITITVTAINAEENNHFIRIHYQDDGRGMTPETLDQLFVPFFTTNRAGGGTGIGMNIIKTIITDQLHGTILVESSPQEGVSFEINLPQ